MIVPKGVYLCKDILSDPSAGSLFKEHIGGFAKALVSYRSRVEADRPEGKLHYRPGAEGAYQGAEPHGTSEEPPDKRSAAEQHYADEPYRNLLKTLCKPNEKRIARAAAK